MIDALARGEILAKLDGVKPSGSGYMARCPIPDHNDSTASLAISPGRDQPVVMHCHGCGAEAQAIADAAGIDWALVSKPRESDVIRVSSDDTWIVCGWDKEKQTYDRRHTKVADYIYRDANDKLIFGVARCALKGRVGLDGKALCQGFRQWRPDPERPGKRKWSRTLPDGTKVGEGLIYRLPEILAETDINYVAVVEGEKDADRLWAEHLPATTCPQGGSKGKSKWTDQHSEWLAGRDIIIVADRDETGWAHAESVANSLMPVARSIEVYRARTGKDVSDHLEAGHGIADLVHVGSPKPLPEAQLVGAA